MTTPANVSLNDINRELARSVTARIDLNDSEVRFFGGQALTTVVSQTFTGSTSWTVPSGVTSVDVLVVGGGAGGAADVGGGGGAGGIVYRKLLTTPGQTYTVTVGGGGAGRVPFDTSQGGAGGTSQFGLSTNRSFLFSQNGYLFANGFTAMNFGSNNFTIEAWVYFNAMPTADNWPSTWFNHQVIVTVGSPSAGDGIGFLVGSSRIAIQNNDIAYWSTAHGMSAGKWYHIAVSRSGNTLFFFVNGRPIGTAAFSTSAGTGSGTYVGCETAQGAFFNGYMADLRIVNGTGLYTSAFPVPQSRLSAVSGTSFLTARGASIFDESPNDIGLLTYGSVTPTFFSPYILTAYGGGGGGCWNGGAGANGACGGGGGGQNGAGGVGLYTDQTYEQVQGFNGSIAGGATFSSGGGGGAGAAGSFVPGQAVGGPGGIGRPYSLTGTLIYYGGGGGGGGGNDSGFDGRGYGGLGGGGTGAARSGTFASLGSEKNGTPNTGGGGGGTGGWNSAGNGGSGVVVIRYFTPNSVSGTLRDMNPMRSLSPPYAGVNFGYTLGGGVPGSNRSINIERFSFTSDGNSVDVGDLSAARGSSCGSQNESNGWNSSGILNPPANPFDAFVSSIERFSFANPGTASIVGHLPIKRFRGVGISSRTHGYSVSGILQNVSSDGLSNATQDIERFSFANENVQSTVGFLANRSTGGNAGTGSLFYGFSSGGVISSPVGSYGTIERFPFASESVTAAVIGSLTQARGLTVGASSPTHGYTIGGLFTPATRYNIIDRFSFFSTENATDVGDLTEVLSSQGGVSSLNNGYSVGGATNTPIPGGAFAASNIIQKFAFAASSNASNVGTLLSTRIQVGTVSD